MRVLSVYFAGTKLLGEEYDLGPWEKKKRVEAVEFRWSNMTYNLAQSILLFAYDSLIIRRDAITEAGRR